ncbi:TadA family conjugal transfer-associated ATPase [Kocuria flava]|uniref:TadA family conjugal transfer-associated ATPase n=1 Tax=Kocuria flava TaxID=446860 RepID=UPI001FF18A0B|nr:TadA family conjugal transfer-associated ATPase [Kocuria flava]MCJ8503615.1 TadA family conjugal transfer-associated ATPase [Kocuria flava]
MSAGDDALLADVRDRLLARPGPVTDADIAAAVRAGGRVLGAAGTLRAVRAVRAELTGLGPLEPLLPARGLTDVYVNGPDRVWVETAEGARQVPSPFADDAEVRALAVRLVTAAGRRLDAAHPCADVQSAAGYRVHAVLPPVSTGGTLLSVRFRSRAGLGLEDLVAAGTVHPRTAELLLGALRCRAGFLVSGATGAGKTTVLDALLSACPAHERIVLIEDAAELRPAHPHVVGLQARHANAEGAGRIDLADLVREALRMRPDRLVVGECRGAEVRELLTALNTGHAGAGTVHANSAAAVPARLAALGALAGMSREAVALQAASALDLVVHVERSGGRREVRSLELLRERDGVLGTVPAAVQTGGRLEPGPGWDALCRLLDRPLRDAAEPAPPDRGPRP